VAVGKHAHEYERVLLKIDRRVLVFIAALLISLLEQSLQLSFVIDYLLRLVHVRPALHFYRRRREFKFGQSSRRILRERTRAQ